ncbi:hypothetical protein C5O19_19975 [Siphonobacter curvatus]|uniref:Uncharacterized protein n=1 Tax=Siphonobacter curvatus TaxID=2094562 RepID=A0A2S7IHY4_9BACT|nr:hypothetical protein C5O19_19975 [Siphonobacter curvatus]
MKEQKLYEFVDRKLEKLAMLLSIEEGLLGLYQLFENINHLSFLTIADKYSIIYDLLIEVLWQELAILEEFTDPQLTTKVKDVDLIDISLILDNPRSWNVTLDLPTRSI